MSLPRFVKTWLACFLVMPVLFTPVFAQSAFEKALVAKSRLADTLWKRHDPASTVKVDHAGWDLFLAKYVMTDQNGINRVSYGSVSAADKKALNAYLQSLQAVDVTKLNRNEQYAFWINLYNAAMVKKVLDHYPVKSVFDIKTSLLDVKGPFNDKLVRVNGKSLTLDVIESGIVRPLWPDPRLHYAFNCAAVSCPNLAKSAYRGDTINAQLDRAAIAYVNDPRGVRIDNGKLTVSKLYFWYSDDFGGNEKAILNHISRYATKNLRASLAGKSGIDAYEYDWALNGSR